MAGNIKFKKFIFDNIAQNSSLLKPMFTRKFTEGERNKRHAYKAALQDTPETKNQVLANEGGSKDPNNNQLKLNTTLSSSKEISRSIRSRG
ncbi:hypothetical protein [Candidatus Tisiphia endosymbiont of Nemotelus uliginosus]|uniref:hypothetical protein n=1 Tax=Candidatus Tisiphia endosymbiont of Nemotelus uliginosus TaxID=3077926 RepID=UPI0035C8B35C